MLRQGLLTLFLLAPLGALGVQKATPFIPRGTQELRELPPKVSKDEGLFLVSELFDLFAVEIDWKYKNPEITQLLKSAKPACLKPISKYPPSYFVEKANVLYIDRDFKRGTEQTISACSYYVLQHLKSQGLADKLEGKLRTSFSIEDLVAFQHDSEFMKKLEADYPNNLFLKYSFAPLAAGKNLGTSGAAVPIQMAPPPPRTAPSIDVDSKPNRTPLVAAGIGILLALLVILFYIFRSKKQKPTK